jgi:hypothetical protein
MAQKTVKVLDHPPTFILIDEDKDEVKAKARWLKLHTTKTPLGVEQLRRENVLVRGGRNYQRNKYKR